MKKKTAIIALIAAGVGLAGLITALVLSGITKKNPPDLLGNTAGNLYNLGLFCESGKYIYFANPDDDGTLYRMNPDCTKITKIYDDKVRYINCDGTYLYYTRVNNLKENGGSMFTFYNTGLYRINVSGSARLSSISTDPSAALLLVGNNIYFQSLKSTGLVFCIAGHDGKSENILSSEAIFPASYHNGSIIYSGMDSDRNIRALDLSTGDSDLIYEGTAYFPIADDDWIYFIDVSDYHIYRTSWGGAKKEVVGKPVCTYNLTEDGRYLFYQADRTDSNYIGRIDLETGEDQKILDGDFKYINVTSNYVFFTSFDETTTYAYALDGSNTLNLFMPGKTKR